MLVNMHLKTLAEPIEILRRVNAEEQRSMDYRSVRQADRCNDDRVCACLGAVIHETVDHDVAANKEYARIWRVAYNMLHDVLRKEVAQHCCMSRVWYQRSPDSGIPVWPHNDVEKSTQSEPARSWRLHRVSVECQQDHAAIENGGSERWCQSPRCSCRARPSHIRG